MMMMMLMTMMNGRAQVETKVNETVICLLTAVEIFLQNPADHVDEVTGVVR